MDQQLLKLMCVMAHPDDETLGTGGLLAKYAAEGVETYLLTATRGEAGWMGDPGEDPGPQALARIREVELAAAAQILGLREVAFLDYCDGELAEAPAGAAAQKIAAHLRRVRPQVVVTFDPFGNYGHPDHIAICQLTTAATLLAASSAEIDGLPPHATAKLYYFADTRAEQDLYQSLFGPLTMNVGGIERGVGAWPELSFSAAIDTRAYREIVWKAAACHSSQIPEFEKLLQLPPEQRGLFWAEQHLYRAFSLVDCGNEVEDDLFYGLRGESISE